MKKKKSRNKVAKNEQDLVHRTRGGKERKNMCMLGREGTYGTKKQKMTQVNGSIPHAQ